MNNFILNSIPNTILVGVGNGVEIVPVTANEVPTDCTSHVGHDNFAEALETILSEAHGETVQVSTNRSPFAFKTGGEVVYAGLVQPTRRLNDGERWTEDEILNFPVAWYKVTAKR